MNAQEIAALNTLADEWDARSADSSGDPHGVGMTCADELRNVVLNFPSDERR